jgi:hypothetical protein
MDVLLRAMECSDLVEDRKSVRNVPTMSIMKEENNASGNNPSNSYVPPVKEVHPSFTRKSCHRCGNIRKNCRKCQNCPHIICKNCVLKMAVMFKKEAFNAHSCPVCALRCCCSNKSHECMNKYHCYRKCPVSRLNRRKQPAKIFPRYCYSADAFTQDSLGALLYGSTAASIVADSDNDSLGGAIHQDDNEEGQDDAMTECEESSGSPSPSPASVPTSTTTQKSAFTITSRGNAMHDLKLPGFLSSGLLLGSEADRTQSSAHLAASFSSGSAHSSSNDKISSDPFYYSV